MDSVAVAFLDYNPYKDSCFGFENSFVGSEFVDSYAGSFDLAFDSSGFAFDYPFDSFGFAFGSFVDSYDQAFALAFAAQIGSFALSFGFEFVDSFALDFAQVSLLASMDFVFDLAFAA